MNRYQRIGILLTGSPGDENALAYAAQLCELNQTQRVACVYLRNSDEPREPMTDDQARAKVEAALANLPAGALQFEAIDRDIFRMLQIARDEQLDLIVVGRRLYSDQESIGSAFGRLARKGPCDVLVVPNYAQMHFGRVLVPVDFSDHSAAALRVGLDLARASGDEHPQVVVQTVFSVGYGYRKVSSDLHTAIKELEQVTCKKLDEFMQGFDTKGVELETVCTCSEKPFAAVDEFAAVRKMDLIVLGSRGATWTTAVVLGSTTERILMGSASPVLIIKHKGETLHLLEALLGS